jgi:succinylglutamic semialdehyde dehydrogenase
VKKFDTESVYQKSEIFGPDVAIYMVDDLEDTFTKVNSSNYGLVASIFTKSREHYNHALNNLDVGLLNWNRTTNGASSKLPFGGTKKSGNGMPSAHFALYYCATPIASLEDQTSFDKSQLMPGLTWE